MSKKEFDRATSEIVLNSETKSLVDKNREIMMSESTSVTNIFRDMRVKDRLEKKAFEALERRLAPQSKMCKACKGDGSKMNGETCGMCQGEGFVVEDADMRAIELVLAPKFPKTQVNINADLDGMDVEGLLGMIEGM